MFLSSVTPDLSKPQPEGEGGEEPGDKFENNLRGSDIALSIQRQLVEDFRVPQFLPVYYPSIQASFPPVVPRDNVRGARRAGPFATHH